MRIIQFNYVWFCGQATGKIWESQTGFQIILFPLFPYVFDFLISCRLVVHITFQQYNFVPLIFVSLVQFYKGPKWKDIPNRFLFASMSSWKCSCIKARRTSQLQNVILDVLGCFHFPAFSGSKTILEYQYGFIFSIRHL